MWLPLLLTLALQDPWEEVTYPCQAGSGVAHRGAVEVPLVREQPESRTVEVEFHRFPAEVDSGVPPIFILRGGPGFTGLTADLKRDGFYDSYVRPMARFADVVVVGQRGIGSSSPNTVCGGFEREDLSAPVDLAERAERQQAGCAECRASWEEKGYDLSGFNVLEAAADVIDVADTLGYDKITLRGTSFGSHWAMAIMRLYPERVERALLGGIEGPDHTYDMPSHVLAAVRRIAAAADAAPELADHIPEGGLLKAYERMIARAEEEPFRFDAGAVVLFDAVRLSEMTLGLEARLSSRGRMRGWPAEILALLDQDFESAARILVLRNFSPRLPTASYFNLDCGSGISVNRRAKLLADPAARLVGPLGAWYEATCPAWDANLGEDFRSGFVTDVPTVLVHGNWDTSTPFENAIEMLPSFRNHAFVVVDGGSHGALREAMIASSAFESGVFEFLRTGSMDALPRLVEIGPVLWKVPEK